MEKSYFLCSEAVVKAFPDCEKSEPFKSGYEHDKEDNYYIALLDFDKVEKYYNNLPLDGEEWCHFWVKELVPGTMDTSTINLINAARKGLFVEIENKIGLTLTSNRAMIIYNLAEEHGVDPIEFINEMLKLHI